MNDDRARFDSPAHDGDDGVARELPARDLGAEAHEQAGSWWPFGGWRAVLNDDFVLA